MITTALLPCKPIIYTPYSFKKTSVKILYFNDIVKILKTTIVPADSMEDAVDEGTKPDVFKPKNPSAE
jgi:hypothetical protein